MSRPTITLPCTASLLSALCDEAKQTGERPGEVFARRVFHGFGIPTEEVLACLLKDADSAAKVPATCR